MEPLIIIDLMFCLFPLQSLAATSQPELPTKWLPSLE